MTERRVLPGARSNVLRLLLMVAVATACGGGEQKTPTSERPLQMLTVQQADIVGVVDWIAKQNGAPVLVNFWATWCGPCIAELPDLLEGTRRFREAGGVVLGVAMEQLGLDIDAEEAVVRAGGKARELGLDFPVLVCTDDEMKHIRQVLGVELGGLPQTLTYDRAGKLVAQHEGMADADTFAELAAAAAR